MNTQTRFESTKEFKPIWESLPAGSIAWKVKTFNGNSGTCVGIEYTLDHDDVADMKEVSDGYFVECYRLTK
jgi:hypothetical protein